MATTDTAALITQVSTRSRDASNTGISRADVLTLLDYASHVVNTHLHAVVSAMDFTPDVGRTLYETTEVSSDALRIIGVRMGGRDLHEVCWTSLVHNHDQWLRLRGTEPQIFATIGRDVWALVPAFSIPGATVSVRYIKKAAALVDDAADFSTLPDEVIPIVLDLVEAVILIRSRQFVAAQQPIARFRDALSIEGPRQDANDG